MHRQLRENGQNGRPEWQNTGMKANGDDSVERIEADREAWHTESFPSEQQHDLFVGAREACKIALYSVPGIAVHCRARERERPALGALHSKFECSNSKSLF